MSTLLDGDGRLRLSSEPPVLRLLAAGDLCPINRLEAPLAAGNVRAVFGDCLPLFSAADLAVINLEAPLCRAQSPISKCGPNFRADPAVAGALKRAGVGLCCLANNHIMDQGPAGLQETLAALDAAGLQRLGAGRSEQEAAQPLGLDLAGRRLALLDFAEGESSRATGGPGAAGLDELANRRAVSEAAARADWTMVFLHAGSEQLPFPSPLMQQRCRGFIDAGAAAVLAHHPHVPQGLELWRGRPIAYSLGNFLFDWPEPEPETDSAFLLEVALAPGAVAGLAVHPFRKSASGGAELLSGAERAAYLALLQDLSAPLGNPARMAALWDEQCRMLWASRYRPRLARFAEIDSPDPGTRQSARHSIYNLLQCEAHREGLARALELLAAGRMACDRAAREEIDGLMTRLKAFSRPAS